MLKLNDMRIADEHGNNNGYTETYQDKTGDAVD